ncbi:MAG TPA: GNAT family N-acetyltransferase [Tepidisphaeraceae bacterium]|jgi:ribosomal protein S18 acetylase RimI-like enzyme|nr:GNAT family N-acetyltransferase [Tepidisphaeraceae bacterium]
MIPQSSASSPSRPSLAIADLHCRPVRDGGEIVAGLRVILSQGPRQPGQPAPPAADTQVSGFQRFAAQRQIDLHDLWIAEKNGAVVWGALPIPSPGRTMLILGPSVGIAETDRPAADLVVEALCGEFGRRGTHLAQVLLDPTDRFSRELYPSRSFDPIAELIYLIGEVGPATMAFALPPLPRGQTLQTYSPRSHGLFADTIVKSYENSLDCPGLGGRRNIEDVLAGHKSAGDFDPAHWWLLLDASIGPAGVMMMSRVPNTDTAELVYLGLVPAARGRGIGNMLMRLAITQVPAMQCAKLTLAVDSGNAPAIRLYHRFGMQESGRRIALMRTLSA